MAIFEQLFEKYDRLVLFDTETTGLASAGMRLLNLPPLLLKTKTEFPWSRKPTMN